METRKQVEAWCEREGVSLSIELWSGSIRHVHANIDKPYTKFRAHDLHNLSLWDGEAAPNWKLIGAELLEADIGPCVDADCECCNA